MNAKTAPDPALLADLPIWTQRDDFVSFDERASRAYDRARSVIRAYRLSAHDILECTDKFWEAQADPLFARDYGAFTVASVHLNLALGTLLRYLPQRPDLQAFVEDLLKMDTIGVYLLTERGHGLDAFNIETTAVRTDEGFILNSPREPATKFMPATTANGFKKVAIVVAKLIEGGVDQGSRHFLVPICDDNQMCSGVTSLKLPHRPGSSPLDFSLTHFNNVKLPHSSLLGSTSHSTKTKEEWWAEVHRLTVGSFAISLPIVQGLKQAAYIVGKYSLHRQIGGREGRPVPIIAFATQQVVVLEALATAKVLDLWWPRQVKSLQSKSVPFEVRHGIAAVFKNVVFRSGMIHLARLSERCGAQGTLQPNFIQQLEGDLRGGSIAEGDILTISIRLFSQLLQGLYKIDLPNPDSILSKRASDLLERAKKVYQTIPGGHRSEEFNKRLLPRAEETVAAIGHALAYDTASSAGIDRALLDVYLSSIMRLDPAWFIGRGGYSSSEDVHIYQGQALSAALPRLDKFLEDLQVSRYITSPIATEDGWEKYISTLPKFSGNAVSKL